MSSSPGVAFCDETNPRLYRIFISYVREEAEIAIAVFNALKSALGPSANVFIDSGLHYGLSFQEEIQTQLAETDTLVVIDSPALRPAYSFTGMELGYFRHVMSHEANRDFPRRIVPVFSEKPQDTLAEYQGIKLDITRATLAKTGKEYEAILSLIDWDHPTVRFLREFQDIVDSFHEKYYGIRIPQSADQKDLPRVVKMMQRAIFTHLRTTPEYTAKPQKQITIRTKNAALNPGDFELPDSALLCPVGTGNPLALFGLESTEITIADFRSRTKTSKLSDSWVDAITTVVTSSLQNQLEVDNSQVIVAIDETHTYRVILTTGIKYYNGDREFNVYFVEYLKRGDHGDHDTTQLLKGLELFCRFRSLFLEQRSEYSGFSVKSARVLTDTARGLEKELNLLRTDAMSLKLDQVHEWAPLLDWSRLDGIVEIWRPLETRLRAVLAQIRRAAPEALEGCRESLVTVLREVEVGMRPLFAGAISEMAEKLKKSAPVSV